MVRWRQSLVLAILLLLPMRTSAKLDDEDDEERSAEESDEDEDEEEEDDEEDNSMKHPERQQFPPVGRRAPPPTATAKPILLARTGGRRHPLECFVCAYKAETPLRACLDPTRFRVHTITCHSMDDKCFTSVNFRGDKYEAIIRGCRSGCVSTPETTCCEANRCNNQAYAMPTVQPRAVEQLQSNTNQVAPNVVFFVTILLLLQTVVKVAIV